MHISRRSFLGTTLASAAVWLAGCGQPAASSSPAGTGSAAASANASPKAASVAASAAPSAKPAAPGTANAVKGAWVALTANMMLWPLAVEAGYFDKYGINFNLQYIQGSVTSVQSMLAGEIDMASIAGSTVVAAQAAKQDIVMTIGYVSEYFWRRSFAPARRLAVTPRQRRSAQGQDRGCHQDRQLRLLRLVDPGQQAGVEAGGLQVRRRQ
jgi:hypothetical protein